MICRRPQFRIGGIHFFEQLYDHLAVVEQTADTAPRCSGRGRAAQRPLRATTIAREQQNPRAKNIPSHSLTHRLPARRKIMPGIRNGECIGATGLQELETYPRQNPRFIAYCRVLVWQQAIA